MTLSRTLVAGMALFLALTTPLVAQKGRKEVEDSLRRATEWLLAHQSPDGRFDADEFMVNETGDARSDGAGNPMYDVGVTALAIMALQRAPDGAPVAAIDRAVHWVLTQQEVDGLFSQPSAAGTIVGHGVTTMALAECLDHPESAFLVPALRRAVERIERHRNPKAAWRYYPRSEVSDTHVTSWMALALSGVARHGIEVQADSFLAIHRWYDTITSYNGHHGYREAREPSARPSAEALRDFPVEHGEGITAMATVARLAMGQKPEDQLIVRAIELLSTKPPDWQNPAARDEFYWFFGTRAMRHAGGRFREIWSRAMTQAALNTQCLHGNAAGSWDPKSPWGSEGGRIYSTTMMMLALADVLGIEPDRSKPLFSAKTRGAAALRNLTSIDDDDVREGLTEIATNPDAIASNLELIIDRVKDSPELAESVGEAIASAFPEAERRLNQRLTIIRARAASADPTTQLRIARLLGYRDWPIPNLDVTDLAGLVDPSPTRRLEALSRLEMNTSMRSLVLVYTALLDDPDPKVREHLEWRFPRALEVDDQAIMEIVPKLGFGDVPERNAALVELGELGTRGDLLWPVVLGLLHGPAASNRLAAQDAVKGIAPRMTHVLESMLSAIDARLTSGPPAERWRQMIALIGSGADAREAKIRAEMALVFASGLRSDDPAVRREAIQALETLGDEAKACESLLGTARLDADPDVRRAAGRIANVAVGAGRVVGARGLAARLLELWQLRNDEVAKTGALALLTLTTTDDVDDLLANDLLAIEQEAAWSIEKPEECIEALVSELASDSHIRVLCAALASGSVRKPPTRLGEALVEHLSPDSGVADAALMSLLHMGPEARPILLRAIEQWIGAGDHHRRQALEVLAAIGRDGLPLFDRVLEFATADTGAWRSHAVAVLDAWVAAKGDEVEGDPSRVDEMVAQLVDADQAKRAAAARSLAALGHGAAPAVGALRRALSDDSPAVRRRSAEALGAIGPAARGSLPDLVGLLTDRDDKVVKAARAAIEGIVAP